MSIIDSKKRIIESYGDIRLLNNSIDGVMMSHCIVLESKTSEIKIYSDTASAAITNLMDALKASMRVMVEVIENERD